MLLVLCIALSGCHTIKPKYSLFESDQEKSLDDLWQQGYGYNNPNVDRIKNDQTRLNFDGSPDTFGSAAKGIGNEIIGNLMAFIIFEAVPAIFVGLKEKFRR